MPAPLALTALLAIGDGERRPDDHVFVICTSPVRRKRRPEPESKRDLSCSDPANAIPQRWRGSGIPEPSRRRRRGSPGRSPARVPPRSPVRAPAPDPKEGEPDRRGASLGGEQLPRLVGGHWAYPRPGTIYRRNVTATLRGETRRRPLDHSHSMPLPPKEPGTPVNGAVVLPRLARTDY